MGLTKEQRDKLSILVQADLVQETYKEIRKENLELTKLEAFNLASRYVLEGLTEYTLKMSQELDKRIALEQRARLEEYKNNKRSA